MKESDTDDTSSKAVLMPAPDKTLPIATSVAHKTVADVFIDTDSIQLIGDCVNIDADIIWNGERLDIVMKALQPDSALKSPRNQMLERDWPELAELGDAYQTELYKAVAALFPRLQRLKDEYDAKLDTCRQLNKIKGKE